MLPDLPQTEAAIVEMTNTFRMASTLQEVKPNAVLAAAARAFAEYLARTGTFAHEADGRKPQDRTQAQGYRHCLVAENLALTLNSGGFETRQLAREVVEGWKNSSGHRENLLLSGATEIGVAVVRVPNRNPKFVSVQLFGRPESLKVTFSIQNQSGKAVTYKLDTETDVLQPRETVTHADCETRRLSIDGAGGSPVRFNPRDGDGFIISPGTAHGIKVRVERR